MNQVNEVVGNPTQLGSVDLPLQEHKPDVSKASAGSSSKKKQSQSQVYKRAEYLGYTEITDASAIPASARSILDNIPKQSSTKVHLEIASGELRLFRDKQDVLKCQGTSLLWALQDLPTKTIVFADTSLTPARCHAVVVKSNTQAAFRFMLHHLGVGDRMAQSTSKRLQLLTDDDQDTRESDTETTIIDSTVVYEAWFVGSIGVPNSTETAMKEVLQHVKHKTKKRTKSSGGRLRGNNVSVTVSPDGLSVLDSLSRTSILSVQAEDVAAAYTFAIDHQHIMTCAVYDEQLDRTNCLMFVCAAGQVEALAKHICLISKRSKDVTSKNEDDDDNWDLDNVFTAKANSTRRMPKDPRLIASNIPRDSLAPLKLLGGGQFGRLYLATYTQFDDEEDENSEQNEEQVEEVAVRLLADDLQKDDLESLCVEALFLLQMDHPNVLRVKATCMMAEPWLMVYSFAQYGDLQSILRACEERNIKLSISESCHFAKQLADALVYLSRKGVVHMNITSKACLIHENNQLKLGDFHNAKPFDSGKLSYTLRHKAKLSLRYMAVETFVPPMKIFSPASDLWSYAVVVWEIFSYGARPYGRYRLTEVHQRVPEGLRLRRPEACPEELYHVLVSCWAAVPKSRPRIGDIARYMKKHVRGERRDIGALISSAWGSKVRRMSVTAAAAQRRKSLRKSMHRKATMFDSMRSSDSSTFGEIGGSLAGGMKNNPLFNAEMDDIWELNGSDCEQDDDMSQDSEAVRERDELLGALLSLPGSRASSKPGSRTSSLGKAAAPSSSPIALARESRPSLPTVPSDDDMDASAAANSPHEKDAGGQSTNETSGQRTRRTASTGSQASVSSSASKASKKSKQSKKDKKSKKAPPAPPPKPASRPSTASTADAVERRKKSMMALNPSPQQSLAARLNEMQISAATGIQPFALTRNDSSDSLASAKLDTAMFDWDYK